MRGILVASQNDDTKEKAATLEALNKDLELDAQISKNEKAALNQSINDLFIDLQQHTKLFAIILR